MWLRSEARWGLKMFSGLGEKKEMNDDIIKGVIVEWLWERPTGMDYTVSSRFLNRQAFKDRDVAAKR
jgi:hypothetical protein